MKNSILIALIVLLLFALKLVGQSPEAIIIDHNCTNINSIPVSFIKQAKQNLIVAYGHTSHGSQLTSGMKALDKFTSSNGFESGLFDYSSHDSDNALLFYDTPFSGASDLGNPDFKSWESATRNYLGKHIEINVVMWSWCGQAGWASIDDINSYLNLMTGLENDFEQVKFVYMTGHLDGSGVDGTLNRNNNIIRTYCKKNGKVLYDFADIESYDPDGEVNYMELNANDNCDYISEEGSNRNWAIEWQNSHIEGFDWYNCSAAHSQALNGNRKAYAAWWLFARITGWQVDTVEVNSIVTQNINVSLKSWVNDGYCVVQIPLNIKIEFVNIYNRIGQLILHKKLNNISSEKDRLLIDLSSLPINTQNNLLFLQFESENGTYLSKVLIH